MDEYARRQAQFGWGSSLELLAYMFSEKRDVWIWIPQRRGIYRRTTTFELPAGQAKGRRLSTYATRTALITTSSNRATTS